MVKQILNRNIYPIEAATAIQYQYASRKIPRDLSTVTPTVSFELGAIYTFF